MGTHGGDYSSVAPLSDSFGQSQFQLRLLHSVHLGSRLISIPESAYMERIPIPALCYIGRLLRAGYGEPG